MAPPSVKRMKREYEETVRDRSEALQLHFDWIENIRQQIQEVKGLLLLYLHTYIMIL